MWPCGSQLYNLLTRTGHRSVRSMYLHCWVSNHKSHTAPTDTDQWRQSLDCSVTSETFQDLTNMFNRWKQPPTSADKTWWIVGCLWSASVGAVRIWLNGETESYILQNTTFILYIWKWYLRLHIWWYCCIGLTFNLFFLLVFDYSESENSIW